MSFGLLGCSSPAVLSDLQEYRSRIANVLDLSLDDLETNITLYFPNSNELKVVVPETTINLRDFYALNNCHVSTLIAQRNTALGKVQLPSTRFIYEKKLIAGLQHCLSLSTDKKQQQQLSSWLELKRQSIPLVWASLMQNSSEMKKTMSDNQLLFSENESSASQGYRQSLAYLLEINNQSQVDIKDVEEALNTLRQNPQLAKIWRTQQLITQHLKSLTSELRTAAPTLQCDTPQSRQKVGYLANVFRLFFVERVQPLASELNQVTYQLTPHLEALQQHSELSPAFKHFMLQNQQRFFDYQQTMKEHIVLWQGLFKQCGISPSDVN